MLSPLARKLVDNYQRGFPVCEQPFVAVGEALGALESEVIEAIEEINAVGALSRLGPVFDHKKAGSSTLAAIAAPEEKLQEVADVVSAFAEVNHNYAREHDFNIWFVVTAGDQDQLETVLDRIEIACGYPVMSLPMERSFHIDLGFKVDWGEEHSVITLNRGAQA